MRMVHGGAVSSVELGFGSILGKLGEVAVELLLNVLSPRLTAHILQWGTVACPTVFGFLYLVRVVGPFRSVRCEAQFTKALAAQVEEKCQLLDKFNSRETSRQGPIILR